MKVKSILTEAHRPLVELFLSVGDQALSIKEIEPVVKKSRAIIYSHRQRLEEIGFIKEAYRVAPKGGGMPLVYYVLCCVLPEIVYGQKTSALTKSKDCMKCKKPFESEGTGNRICGECKDTKLWRDGDPLVDFTVHSPQ